VFPSITPWQGMHLHSSIGCARVQSSVTMSASECQQLPTLA
jgi:hypothetical protein